MTRNERVELQSYLEEKFRGVDKRLDGVDKRLEGMDKRLDGIDQRFSKVESHLNRQDAALEQTTMSLLLTIEEEGDKARRYAERLFAIVDPPLGNALEAAETRDRSKRLGPARRLAK